METNDAVVPDGGISPEPSTGANTQCGPPQPAQPPTSSTHFTSQLDVSTDTQQPGAGRPSALSGGGGGSLSSAQSGDGGGSLPFAEQVQTVPTEMSKDDDFQSLSEVTSVDGPLVPQSKEESRLEKVHAVPRPAAVGGALGAGPRAVATVGSITGRGKGKQNK